MKKLTAILLIAVFAATQIGCFFDGPTKKKLPAFFTESPVVSARYYNEGEFVELEQEKLAALIDKLNEMELSTHSFHTDYYWGGRLGIELSYEDGTFMTYDGTKAIYRTASMKDDRSNDAKIRNDFIEVTNLEFWNEMSEFFPIVPENMPSGW